MSAMASKSQRLLLTILLIWISIVSTSARPCKTLFVSSYSFSLRQPQFHSSSGFVTIFAEVTQFRRVNVQPLRKMPLFPLSASTSPYDLTSLRDRTKDILSVVVALLFGVGCGALTAATMYLAWSLFSTRYQDDADDTTSAVVDDDGLSPKKMGYVKIPTADAKQTDW
uniref:Transmembrane protein n=1 Tax=Cannabis sativa TaxID=3483 RepID=A0A803Q2D4_CANSA